MLDGDGAIPGGDGAMPGGGALRRPLGEFVETTLNHYRMSYHPLPPKAAYKCNYPKKFESHPGGTLAAALYLGTSGVLSFP